MSSVIDTLITDRRAADVQNGTAKGRYTADDMNRVGAAQLYLKDRLAAAGTDALDIVGRTDWSREDGMIPKAALDRYLADTRAIVNAVPVQAELPTTMRRFNARSANKVEAALKAADAAITSRESVYLRAGLPWAVSGAPTWRFAN